MQQNFLIKKYCQVLKIEIVDILIFQYKFIKISKLPVLYLDALTINAGKDIQLDSIHFLFPRVRLDVCSEIIKAFICLQFNISKAIEYLKNEKKSNNFR